MKDFTLKALTTLDDELRNRRDLNKLTRIQLAKLLFKHFKMVFFVGFGTIQFITVSEDETDADCGEFLICEGNPYGSAYINVKNLGPRMYFGEKGLLWARPLPFPLNY